MITSSSVGGNEIYSINRVECRDAKGEFVSVHYEIMDLFRKKPIAICSSLKEANKKFDSMFTPLHEPVPLVKR